MPIWRARCAPHSRRRSGKNGREYLGELVQVEEAVRRAHDRGDGWLSSATAPMPQRRALRGQHLDPARTVEIHLAASGPGDVGVSRSRGRGRKRGPGAELDGLGGVRDARFSRPVTVTSRIGKLFDARFVMSGHLAKNMAIDMGPAVVLRGRHSADCGDVALGPALRPALFHAAGIDPFAASVLVAKSPCGFRAAYADRAREIMVVKAPGCAPADFWTCDYLHIPHPLWPWDEIAAWSPSPVLAGRPLR